ncbi:MAG: hypothetical protein POH28_00335 [Acidocella sp.]|nr:hypothetical protein [Acidocella sp.]
MPCEFELTFFDETLTDCYEFDLPANGDLAFNAFADGVNAAFKKFRSSWSDISLLSDGTNIMI